MVVSCTVGSIMMLEISDKLPDGTQLELSHREFGLLDLEVADGTAGSLLGFFRKWRLMSFHSPCV